MHTRPRKPTLILRENITQDLRVVLEPELDAPADSYRRVQVLIPPSPDVFVGLDVSPEELGINRTYKVPLMAPGAQIPLHLQAHQFIIAAVGESNTPLTIIVEFF